MKKYLLFTLILLVSIGFYMKKKEKLLFCEPSGFCCYAVPEVFVQSIKGCSSGTGLCAVLYTDQTEDITFYPKPNTPKLSCGFEEIKK